MTLSCDEWFHTLCVNVPDLEIDLVDQFICPPCIQSGSTILYALNNLLSLYASPQNIHICGQRGNGGVSLDSNMRILHHPKRVTSRRVACSQSIALTTAA